MPLRTGALGNTRLQCRIWSSRSKSNIVPHISSMHLQRIRLQNVEEIFLSDALPIVEERMMGECPKEGQENCIKRPIYLVCAPPKIAHNSLLMWAGLLQEPQILLLKFGVLRRRPAGILLSDGATPPGGTEKIPTYINCHIIPRSVLGMPRSIAFASSSGWAAAYVW